MCKLKCRLTTFAGITALALLGTAGNSEAQVSGPTLYCYDAQTDLTVPVSTLGGSENCEGSVSKVFSGTGLSSLTGYALVQNAVALCDLPDGPYQFGPNQPLDYVLGTATNPMTGNTITINPSSIGVSGVAPVFNITTINDSGGDIVSVLQADPTLKSQVLDLPSYEFLYATPSAGKGNPQIGLLICDNKIWGRQTGADPHYGVRRLQLTFTSKDLTIGLAGGPSGAGSAANAGTICTAVNSTATLEKKVAYIVGNYKTTATSPANPANITGCTDPQSGAQLTPNYCDPTEMPGTSTVSRPNSCNPDGETGGTVLSSDSSTVYGPASTYCFSGRGTATCLK